MTAVKKICKFFALIAILKLIVLEEEKIEKIILVPVAVVKDQNFQSLDCVGNVQMNNL